MRCGRYRSGTGISSELFLQNGNTVYGIEPNEAMRKAAEELLSGYENFISMDGTAEDTKLGDKTIDTIVAGQAFHWFTPDKAKTEFKRILKDNGWVILIWNKKNDDASPFMKEYAELLSSLSTDYNTIKHENTDDKMLSSFFESYRLKTFPNVQVFDLEGLTGRYLSSSYAPLHGAEYDSSVKTIETLFEKYSHNGKVDFIYKTQLYYGKV
jgi:ubiquinone/menaquinone biosynthesis C-methylase UbiE